MQEYEIDKTSRVSTPRAVSAPDSTSPKLHVPHVERELMKGRRDISFIADRGDAVASCEMPNDDASRLLTEVDITGGGGSRTSIMTAIEIVETS